MYRTDLGVAGRDDPRKKDMFRNIRSGVSTASTTSRSTTKTSSSPYGYGATLPHYRGKLRSISIYPNYKDNHATNSFAHFFIKRIYMRYSTIVFFVNEKLITI